MDLEEYRVASLRQWEGSADGWERRREEMQRWAVVVSEWLVDAISPAPGQVVLELAAGSGDTGFLAARRIEPGGRLITSDFAEPMLDTARRRAAELGVENVEFRVLNAESLSLDAAAVDAVLCRWGFMLMADPGSALQESRRVLRPGGRLALAAWDGPEANPWVSLIGREVRRELGAPEPDSQAPGMFAFASPGRIERLLADAGFGDVEVEPLEFEVSYFSFEEWWAMQLDLGRPLAEALDSCTREQREAVRRSLRRAAAGFADERGHLTFPARTLVARASA